MIYPSSSDKKKDSVENFCQHGKETSIFKKGVFFLPIEPLYPRNAGSTNSKRHVRQIRNPISYLGPQHILSHDLVIFHICRSFSVETGKDMKYTLYIILSDFLLCIAKLHNKGSNSSLLLKNERTTSESSAGCVFYSPVPKKDLQDLFFLRFPVNLATASGVWH